MTPVIIGTGVIVVMFILYVLSKTQSAPVASATGGTSLSGSPSVTPPATGTIAAVSTANPTVTPTPAGPKETAQILIIKDTSSQPDAGTDQGWRTFQVAEVFAYSSSRKLDASDYSSATLSSAYKNNMWPGSFAIDSNPNTFSHTDIDPIGVLTLTLKNPAVITKVEVLNRQDCCQGRLAGAKLVLKDATGAIIWTGTLTGEKDVQVYTM